MSELSHVNRARLMGREDIEATIRMFTARSRSDKEFAATLEAYRAELVWRDTADMCGLDDYAAELLLDGDDDDE